MNRLIDDGTGGKRNAEEIRARVESLRTMNEKRVYNPAVDPSVLEKAASEAARAATPLPAMKLNRHNEGDVRLATPDPEAEAMTKGQRHVEAENKGGEGPQGSQGNEGVQERDPTLGVSQRAEGQEPQAGDSNRHERERTEQGQTVWIEKTYQADTKEAVSELVPTDARAVTYKKVWQATALVRQL